MIRSGLFPLHQPLELPVYLGKVSFSALLNFQVIVTFHGIGEYLLLELRLALPNECQDRRRVSQILHGLFANAKMEL